MNNDTNSLSTPLLQDWLGDDQAKRFRREVHFPSGRFGEAIEQAQAVLFLASDESSFVNGTDFVVDGGLSKVRCRGRSSQNDANPESFLGVCDPGGPRNCCAPEPGPLNRTHFPFNDARNCTCS